MKWLLWKDYRHNRLIVIAGLVILLGPYLIGFGILCGASWIQTGTQDGQPVYWTPEWRDILGGACAYSLILSQVTLALIGGNAISGERVDRSAEFLYSMPVTRRKLLASKLTLALIVTAVIWLTSAVVFVFVIPPHEWAALRRVGELPRLNWVAVMSVGTVPITGITFFCIA